MPAPIGYLNDPRIKHVVINRKKSKIIKGGFEFYSQGDKTFEAVAHFLAQLGIVKKNSKIWHGDRVKISFDQPILLRIFSLCRRNT